MVYGANFSIGVNLFYRIVKHAAALFAAVDGYAPFIEEAHHSRKRDAPSGTALKLRDLMSEHLGPDIPDLFDSRRLHSRHASRRF